jgi:hypothetical protein
VSVRVKLPSNGCSGLVSRLDGTRYDGKPGSTITIADHHAAEIAVSKRGDSNNGLLSLKEGFSFGTKKGRFCESCSRLWNAWSVVCPRCGNDTVPAED